VRFCSSKEHVKGHVHSGHGATATGMMLPQALAAATLQCGWMIMQWDAKHGQRKVTQSVSIYRITLSVVFSILG
jgi:hypothetical protein